MELTAENVVETVKSCLYETTPEDISKAVIVEGIMAKFGFDPERLAKKKADIESMLGQLPASFQKSGGGGCSFLAACERADGVQWTGLHKTMDELFVLGLAVGKVQLCLPRAMWNALPGGMPYYVVT
jgi:hypothetical protein